MSATHPSESDALQESGRVVAQRYRLDVLLGRGAMGEVWRATHLGLGAPVALKLIDPKLFAGKERNELVARFEREARAAAALQSNHVVKVTDHGTDERGTPYMAMELLQGESLQSRLDRVERMSPTKTLAIVTQLSRAMSQAHELGIVHRDLKPENVFLAQADGQETVKVLDFGIAKLMRSPLDIASHATSTGQLLGTPCYMSPEQASGAVGVDHRADLWAIAVITYECMTGRLPFLSQNFGELVLAICTRPLPVPSAVAPDLPPGFDRWWVRAAARDPAGRFQSATALCQALADAIEGRAPAEEGHSTAPVSAPPLAPDLARTIASAIPVDASAPTGRGRVGVVVGALIGVLAGGLLFYRFTRGPDVGPASGPASSEVKPAAKTSTAEAPAVTTVSTPAPEVSATAPSSSGPDASASQSPPKPAVPNGRPRPASAPSVTPPASPPPTSTIDPRLGL